MPGASQSPESSTSRVKGCWAGRPVLGELPSLALGPTGPGSKLPGAGEDAFRPIGAGLSKSRRGVRLVLSHLCTCLSVLSFFAAGSVPGNRSGYQCTSGWWGKGRVKAEPSEQEQPTFESTSQLRPGRAGAGEVRWGSLPAAGRWCSPRCGSGAPAPHVGAARFPGRLGGHVPSQLSLPPAGMCPLRAVLGLLLLGVLGAFPQVRGWQEPGRCQWSRVPSLLPLP